MMRRLNYNILFGILVLFAAKVSAQQIPMYSQYMMNKFLLNPAVAGSEGYTSFNLTAREQWVGFPHSPKTHSLSYQSRILRNSFISKSSSIRRKRRNSKRSGRVGYGFHIYNDQNGQINRTGLQGTYAYHMNIKESQLSFGLTLNMYQYKLDELKTADTDTWLESQRLALYIPDANFGVYYSDRDRYFGLSVDELFQSTIKFGNQEASDLKERRDYYFMGGHFFDVSREIILEPSTLIKFDEKLSAQWEIGTKGYYNENYWAGLAYRTGAEGGAFIVLLGAQIDKFFVSYAFDYQFSDVRRFSYGSHEIIVAAKFGDSARRYRWLNRY